MKKAMKDALFFIIVPRGRANQLLHAAQQMGAHGGTIFLGQGTLQSRWLDWLGINQTQKDILLMAVPEGLSDRLYVLLGNEFQLHKRFYGIAFAVPYRQWQPEYAANPPAPFSRDTQPPYLCLLTVLDRGRAEECMAIARQAGAQGGTIIHGRGAGVPQDFYVPLNIEPQKDIVLIVAPFKAAQAIHQAMYTGLGLHNPGQGILFSLPVQSTIGLYAERGQNKSRAGGKNA